MIEIIYLLVGVVLDKILGFIYLNSEKVFVGLNFIRYFLSNPQIVFDLVVNIENNEQLDLTKLDLNFNNPRISRKDYVQGRIDGINILIQQDSVGELFPDEITASSYPISIKIMDEKIPFRNYKTVLSKKLLPLIDAISKKFANVPTYVILIHVNSNPLKFIRGLIRKKNISVFSIEISEQNARVFISKTGIAINTEKDRALLELAHKYIILSR